MAKFNISFDIGRREGEKTGPYIENMFFHFHVFRPFFQKMSVLDILRYN